MIVATLPADFFPLPYACASGQGHRPLDDEPDPRPLPSSDAASLGLESLVEALSNLFLDTRLEADLPDLLWSFVNLFHRKLQRIDRELDEYETAQRQSQAHLSS